MHLDEDREFSLFVAGDNSLSSVQNQVSHLVCFPREILTIEDACEQRGIYFSWNSHSQDTIYTSFETVLGVQESTGLDFWVDTSLKDDF